MRYKQQKKTREFFPAIAAIFVAIVALLLAANTLFSGAVDYREPETFEEPQAAAPVEIEEPVHNTADAIPTVKEQPKETKQPEQAEKPMEMVEPETGYQSIIGSRDWGLEESQILLKIAMAEAEGESVEGKALVMLVVLNRVWSDRFPNTIEEVVFQKGQFSPTVPGGRYWTTEPNEGCYEALDIVLSGWDMSSGSLYFESCKGESWHSRNLEFVLEHGNHRFYK